VSAPPGTSPGPSAKPPKPLWRQAYDAVDARVAPQLESLVQTQEFAQALSLGMRASVGARRFVERRSRRL
jgi:hypothetical protein